MKEKDDSILSNAEALSRRAALRRVMAVGVGLAGLPALAAEATVPPLEEEAEYVPENDYPFFGYQPQPE